MTTSNTGHHPYLGLDWFILDLLASSTVFIIFEKLFPLYDGQPVFRTEWQVDMKHFLFNHLSVGAVLLCINFFVHRLFSWAAYEPLQQAIAGLPYALELFLAVLVADLVQYGAPGLSRGAVPVAHPCGAPQHPHTGLAGRIAAAHRRAADHARGGAGRAVRAGLFQAGAGCLHHHRRFPGGAHPLNVKLPWGWLRYIIVTPDFHHWHHSSDNEAIDRNYAAHLSFIDYLFGTAVRVSRRLPENYGILDNDMPGTFLAQQAYPFRKK